MRLLFSPGHPLFSHRLLACLGFVNALGVAGTVLASFDGEAILADLLSLSMPFVNLC